MNLTQKQLNDRVKYIGTYMNAQNASTGSEVDSNANVTQKTVATLESELYKKFTIEINRKKVSDKLKKMFDSDIALTFGEDVRGHLIYCHDETSLRPYCASISLYPYLLEGTKVLGGVSSAPKNLQSYCGSFVNLIYQVASNFAGAVATVEFLHIFDWFARNQYGDNYLETHTNEIKQELQGVVYSLNQPASARGDQSVFWNISVFDKFYLQEMFGEFFYPDGTQLNNESVLKLQEFFMEWFRLERRKELLTYPVLTASLLLDKEGNCRDEDFRDLCATQMSKGHSFFVYMSEHADSLASCCRLRNELADNTFSYSLGAGGVVTGSAQVITLNLNRLAFQAKAYGYTFGDYLRKKIQDMHKYLLAYREVYKEYINAGLLPVYTSGMMDLDKQFLTLGVNGLLESAEFFGFTPNNNAKYKKYIADVLNNFKVENKKALKQYGVRFNTELVPAENLGVKNAMWDKKVGMSLEYRDCYNSYFYRVEDTEIDILDKIALYNEEVTNSLDGGSALHLNIEQLPSFEQMKSLYSLCGKNKVPYWTINVLCTICDKCHTIDPVTRKSCAQCGNKNVEYGTRVIGYLKRVSNFSQARQFEHERRHYHIMKE